jgi:hypothetical protein
VGPEHLSARALAVAVLAVSAGACRPAPALEPERGPRVTLGTPAGARGAHVQFVRALPMSERVALVERWKARNGPEWSITLGAGGAPDDVDAIRGVVRRAKRESTPATETPGVDVEAWGTTDPAEKERAIAEAVAFLARNADFFGLSPADVSVLDVAAGRPKTRTYGSWVVILAGRIPMRGYEGFAAVTAHVDIAVYVGDDGKTRYFINLSRLHPRLVLDTHAGLGPDDKRLLRFVLGRELFVVFDDPRRPEARVRELSRLSVGRVEDGDVRSVRLTVHVSPGPRGSYVSYTLAYAIDVKREGHEFRFVVDADTGDLLEDAVVPVVPSRLEGAGDDDSP